MLGANVGKPRSTDRIEACQRIAPERGGKAHIAIDGKCSPILHAHDEHLVVMPIGDKLSIDPYVIGMKFMTMTGRTP